MAAPTPENYPASPKSAPPDTPIVQAEQKPEKNKLLKPALIVFSVVLVILISEVGYLVFKGYGKTYLQPNAPASIPTPTYIPTPTPASLLTLEEVESTLPKEFINSDKARVFADTLDRLEPKTEFLLSATVNFVIAGTVVSLTEEEAENLGKLVVITMKNDSGLTLKDKLTQEEVENSFVLLRTPAGASLSKIAEIKPGDFVFIRHITNLLDASTHSKIILEVVREQ